MDRFRHSIMPHSLKSRCDFSCRCTIRLIMSDWQGEARELPDTINWPKHSKRPRGRRILLVLLVLTAGIVVGGRTALSYWVDLLWFKSLGYGDVFWKTWTLQWGIFAVFATATFFILYGAFLGSQANLIKENDLPIDHSIVLGGQPVNLSVEPLLRGAAFFVSLGIAGATGATMMEEWPALSLFWYAPHAAGNVSDPIFGKPLSFFLFTLPAWHLIVGWLLTLSVMTCVLAVVFIFITGGFRALDKRPISYAPTPWRGLS